MQTRPQSQPSFSEEEKLKSSFFLFQKLTLDDVYVEPLINLRIFWKEMIEDNRAGIGLDGM